ncbi:hypothetical protein EJ04DRAFT_582406 [Polyplosphaeria fusca]|uniref:Uncharacterized protein n=1 Tax=Polyplosphaeria fusca TaxID=682080 RepID=A0A9P4UVL1_9PLEO|nr:hypothetical protein EJ04DRAFT_582406 [Polyplosphaeria fusca]
MAKRVNVNDPKSKVLEITGWKELQYNKFNSVTLIEWKTLTEEHPEWRSWNVVPEPEQSAFLAHLERNLRNQGLIVTNDLFLWRIARLQKNPPANKGRIAQGSSSAGNATGSAADESALPPGTPNAVERNQSFESGKFDPIRDI